MIHGYMATFGMYGSWMPNDPRGTKSRFVGGRRLYDKGGKVTSADGQAFARLGAREVESLEALTQSLKRPAVRLSTDQMNSVGQSVGRFAASQDKTVWALAVLPLHVHIVFARCLGRSEEFVDQLKIFIEEDFATGGLLPQGCDAENSVWAKGRWIDYLDSEQSIESAIDYTNANPIEIGLAKQTWPFIVPFTGIESNIVSYPDSPG